MPKVSVHLGLTFPGAKEFTSFRADVTFAEIDTEGDLEAQKAACLALVDDLAVTAEAALAQEASNVSGLNMEGAGIGAEFAKFRDRLKPAWVGLVDRINALEKDKPKSVKKTKKAKK